jgi:phage terminase large subunit-like protein
MSVNQIESPQPKRRRGRPPKTTKLELTRGEKNIKWIQDHCVIPEGRDVGRPVVLRDWQRDWIKRIYDNPAGTRRAIISVGRKNAKSTLAAFLLLLHLCGREHKVNSSLYSAAQSKEQAAIIFRTAAKIVRLSPHLRDFIVIRETIKQLECPRLGTLYHALSAEASTAMGLSPIFIIHDELGQCRSARSELYEALETATGAQDEPLSIVISTQAPTDKDLLSQLIDDAQAGHDPRIIVSLYTAPKDLDPFAESTIRLANPAFGDFLNAREVLGMAEAARRLSSKEADYRNLILNQRVEASSPFISLSLWEACGAKPEPLDELDVYGGLDLSAVNDLTALVLIGQRDGIWHVHPTFWLPGDGLAEKAAHDRVPYDLWHKEGYLQAAPGKSVDYEDVAIFLRSVFDRYQIRKIGFDDWAFTHLKPWLIKAGFSEGTIAAQFESFRQGSKSMTPALRVLEGEILNGRLAHGGHPVMSMCMANAVVQGTDDARRLDKLRSRGRIDGAVALAMAMGVVPLPQATAIDASTLIF